MKSFEELLVEYGLVQFGRFADGDGEFVPFKLNLDWMVSYPDVLAAAALEVRRHFLLFERSIHEFERILCPLDTLPIATLVSTQTGIPLVYSRGTGESTVKDLVGAYDINHPTLLLANTTTGDGALGQLQTDARRVGLLTTYALVLIRQNNDEDWQELNHHGEFLHVNSLARFAISKGVISEAFMKEVLRFTAPPIF
ncbi:MAG: hypothetical protein AAFU54_21865 [Chloroflexota bacterium]